MTIKINNSNKSIEITKAFAKKASIFGSDEYKMLKEARNDFPTYKVVSKSAGKKSGTFKGLTLKYMKEYIKTHDEENLKNFYVLCGLDENGEALELAASASYGEIKKWFLSKYHIFNEYSKKVNEVLKSA